MNKQMKAISILSAMLLVVIFVFVGLVIDATSSSNSAEVDNEVVKVINDEDTLALINKERTDRGISPLVRDTHVQLSAQMKADHMQDNNYYSHDIPGLGYTLTPEMGSEVKKSCKDGASTENIAKLIPDDTPEALVAAWMASAPHKEAILNPEFNITGLAISKSQVYSVQHFCTAL